MVRYVAIVGIGVVSAGLVVACADEELNPASPRQTPVEAGADADPDAAGLGEAGAFAGYPCNSIVGCVQGCRTSQCPNTCVELASPKARGVIQQWQVCLDGARAASCAPYCALPDAGMADAGGGGDAGASSGPESAICSVCALTVCKAHLDACVADK